MRFLPDDKTCPFWLFVNGRGEANKCFWYIWHFWCKPFIKLLEHEDDLVLEQGELKTCRLNEWLSYIS